MNTRSFRTLTLMVALLAPMPHAVAAGITEAGRALYRGMAPWSAPVQVAGVALPQSAGAMTACASCHGVRGEGKVEAGIAIPPLTWHALMQAAVNRPAFRDAAQVLAAIMNGRGRGGAELQAPMPRFDLSGAEQQALLAYLQTIGTEDDTAAGVYADRILVASVLPLSGSTASTGERVRAALTARFDTLNRRGGVWGRRLELRAVNGGSDAAYTARALMQGGDVLALVASILPHFDPALAGLGVPMVATLGVASAGAHVDGITHLLPDLQQQLRSLAAEMAKQCPDTDRAATAVLVQVGSSLQRKPDALQWHEVATGDADFSDPALAESARLISLLPAAQHRKLRVQLARARPSGKEHCLGTLAVVTATPDSEPRLPGWREVVVLPMPLLPDVTDHWTLLGETAADVLIEALSRSGRQLDPARLARAVQSLERFEPHRGLHVSFGAGRESGFEPEFIWR